MGSLRVTDSNKNPSLGVNGGFSSSSEPEFPEALHTLLPADVQHFGENDLTSGSSFEEEEEEEEDNSMDEYSDDQGWMEWFLSLKGHRYFCEVDEEYIQDRFNLTGLQDIRNFSQAIALILDKADTSNMNDEDRIELEKTAKVIYGLIHARFVVTAQGLAKMMEKYKNADFGTCPRVYCNNQPILPVGLVDYPRVRGVKLFCPRCEDVFHPRDAATAEVDGAYFGTTFPHLFFQTYPAILPSKATSVYIPRIFGFKIHSSAKQYFLSDAKLKSISLDSKMEPDQN